MTQWKISFPINGLHDVIKEPSSELNVDKVRFYYREKERIGSIIVNADKQSDAENEAAYQINRSLSKICFAYNTEASLGNGYYAIDLTKDPNNEWVYAESKHRWPGTPGENPQTTLQNIASIKADDKREVLDLALAYYKLSEYANPLRIESLFSCMTVLARDLLNKGPNGHVFTSDLKQSIKDILCQRTSNFNEPQFDQDWESFYSEERCSISHGKGSKLINVKTLREHEKIVYTVTSWTMEMIYYFIDKHKA